MTSCVLDMRFHALWNLYSSMSTQIVNTSGSQTNKSLPLGNLHSCRRTLSRAATSTSFQEGTTYAKISINSALLRMSKERKLGFGGTQYDKKAYK